MSDLKSLNTLQKEIEYEELYDEHIFKPYEFNKKVN